MEEKIFVGYNYGNAEDRDTKRLFSYCNIYMMEEFKGNEGPDYRFAGHKANKYKCVSPDVWKDIKIGDRVVCFFDSYGRVMHMQKVETKA